MDVGQLIFFREQDEQGIYHVRQAQALEVHEGFVLVEVRGYCRDKDKKLYYKRHEIKWIPREWVEPRAAPPSRAHLKARIEQLLQRRVTRWHSAEIIRIGPYALGNLSGEILNAVVGEEAQEA